MDIHAYQHMRISTRGKRPLRNLTPGDKVRAIQRIHNGETKASVSRDIGVPESTLRGWCKNEQKLRFMCRQLGEGLGEQRMPIENPPEKRCKLKEAFDISPSYGFDRLGSLCSVNRTSITGIDMDRKSNGFISNKVIEELIQKNGATNDDTQQIFGDSASFPEMSTLLTATNYPQLPLIQNMALFSLLNPNLSISGDNADSKFDCVSSKLSTHASVNSIEAISNPKTQFSPVSGKNLAHEGSCSPLEDKDNNTKNNISRIMEKNDSNNNDVRNVHSLSSLDSQNEYGELSTLFPNGIPLPPIPPVTADARSDALLQWSKVFNATLSFLALATAAAAIQCPTSTSPFSPSNLEIKCEATPDSSHELHKLQGYFSPYTPPIFQQSEDSNFESEPEDLSVRSGTSKVSSSAYSRPQSPTKDIMSDSLTVSDEEY